MINAVSITTMLANHVAKKDSYRPSGNLREQQLADHLYQILDNVITSSSYEVEDENTLDYDDLFDDAHEDEQCDVEADEENGPSFCAVEDEDELGDDALLQKFSLEYMTNVIDFYNEIDTTTGKRKHTWKSVQHR
ncbi:unnamed protein product, partial [Adineta ricciae]